ncbi:hypothetical protein GCM10019016_010560 [Streptomyces prasinosporus]|uniref:Uncharacterized protein n=1 Tax=Streptomyces prasinosporus TaxID=68256 RepID=A0ABP6TFJ2_9ACTN|nr:hypothetical protein GCM10010332_74040 [Streptomyces albogriseolus]
MLGDAEYYNSRRSTSDSRLDQLERQPALRRRLVDAGVVSSRCFAQDAEDVRARSEAMAREFGDPLPSPRRPQ